MSALRGVVDVRSAGGTGGASGRILDATIACLARFGVAKTTLDDVAREAGCARATVYRYFPGKSALVAAAAAVEIERIAATISAAGDAQDTLEDAITAMMATAARELAANEALAFVLAHEPELVLPHCSFSGGDRLLAEASARFAPTLARFLPPERAERAAEWCTRALLAHLHPDDAPISVRDDAPLRAVVHQYVVPGCVAGAAPRPDPPRRR